MNCISLHAGSGESDIRCRTRPDEGLDAILRLQPGMFTGHPSEVFGSFIGGLVKVGYVPVRDIIALPYDWRLSPMMLQRRDRYFTVMRRMIELMVETHRSPDAPREESRVTLISHSLGSSVVRYFLDWLREEVGANSWQAWIDDHVGTFVAVSAPLLGSPDTVKGVMSGHTFGALPVTMENCRRMGLSFGSSPWMLPVDLRKMPRAGAGAGAPAGLDNYRAVVNDTSAWPVPVVLEFDEEAARAAPQLVANGTMAPAMDEVTGGRYFHALGESFDDEFALFAEKVDAYNERGVLEPWLERPPFDRVVFAFGTNLQTAISHRWKFRGDYGPFKRWQHLERIYEDKGGSILRSARAAAVGVGTATGMSKSGDQVVPYLSLALCHAWLPDRVNITRVPQRLHSPAEVLAVDNVRVREFERNLECTQRGGGGCAPGAEAYNTTAAVSPSDLYDTFYEARWLNPAGRPMHTYVWEFEGQTHRELLRSDIFMVRPAPPDRTPAAAPRRPGRRLTRTPPAPAAGAGRRAAVDELAAEGRAAEAQAGGVGGDDRQRVDPAHRAHAHERLAVLLGLLGHGVPAGGVLRVQVQVRRPPAQPELPAEAQGGGRAGDDGLGAVQLPGLRTGGRLLCISYYNCTLFSSASSHPR